MADLLMAKDVHCTLGGATILRDFSLRLRAGSRIALLGPSGSGKSTALRLLAGLESPSQGEIQRLTPHRPGFVFQQFHVFTHLTALENCMLALRKVRRMPPAAARQRALQALDEVGLAPQAQHRPSALSGGQAQRVAIARALCLEPDILLFDEPTSALDPETATEVLQVIQALADKGMAMVLVTHALGFVRHTVDDVQFLDQGRTLWQGPVAEFFAPDAPERIRRFVAAHQP